jgi:hypothetical protein
VARTQPLTPAEIRFLSSLRAGARPTSACQDAITVGALIRSKLVWWNTLPVADASYRRPVPSFSLTRLGIQRLREHEAGRAAISP